MGSYRVYPHPTMAGADSQPATPEKSLNLFLTFETLPGGFLGSIMVTSEGDKPPPPPAPRPMLPILPSTRFAAFLGDAERVAALLLKQPRVIGGHRATLLLNLAQTNRQGRAALQACAKAANRHRVLHADGSITQNDRVFSKASTKRLAMWAQDRNSKI